LPTLRPPATYLRLISSITPEISLPAELIDTTCRLPIVVSLRLAAKFWLRAETSMRLPLALPVILPLALWVASLHEPVIAPPW